MNEGLSTDYNVCGLGLAEQLTAFHIGTFLFLPHTPTGSRRRDVLLFPGDLAVKRGRVCLT